MANTLCLPHGDIRRRHTRKKVVATVRRQRARLQVSRQAERAFLRKRRNDEAYDGFFCKEKSEWSKVHSDVAETVGFEPTCRSSRQHDFQSCSL